MGSPLSQTRNASTCPRGAFREQFLAAFLGKAPEVLINVTIAVLLELLGLGLM